MLSLMIEIFKNLPRSAKILLSPVILIGIANHIDSYKKNSKLKDSALTVHDLSDYCPAAIPPALLPLTGTTSALFSKPSCTLESDEHAEKLDINLLRTRIQDVIKKDPSLEPELTPFLDCSQITLEDRYSWFRSGKTLHTVALRSAGSDLARKNFDDKITPLIISSPNEFIYIRPPRDNSPAAIKEYRALKRIYNFPKEVRDQILLNKKLMKLFEDKKIKIEGQVNKRSTSYEIHVKKAGQTFIHTFQKTFVGYWRYVGEAEKNSVRYASHKILGRSLVF